MDVRRAYCSAVDRNVPVRLKAGAVPRDRLSLHDPSELICLDYRVRCSGWCCPLFSVSDDDAAATSPGRTVAPRPTQNPQRRWTRPT